jgi:hypothetical protein
MHKDLNFNDRVRKVPKMYYLNVTVGYISKVNEANLRDAVS